LAFKSAGLPLFRVKAGHSYQPNNLKKEIFSISKFMNKRDFYVLK